MRLEIRMQQKHNELRSKFDVFFADRNYGILRLGTGSLQGALEGALAIGPPPFQVDPEGGALRAPALWECPPQISMGPNNNCFIK